MISSGSIYFRTINKTILRTMLTAAFCILFSSMLHAVPFPKYVDVEEAQAEVTILEEQLRVETVNRESCLQEEEELKNKLHAQQIKKLKLEKAKDDLQLELSALHRKKVRTPDMFKRTSIDTDIQERQEAIDRVDEEIEITKAAIAQLETQIDDANTRRRISEAKIGKAEERLPLLKAAIKRTNTEQAKLNSKMEAAEEALEDIADILDEYSEE